ncbi:cytochrome c biogenesis heme-transporting ATPase CcmA [Noviherbaspirillum album]|uniref:cytochrome c biogenesis heme-transporting ATPase CcmA n=1 Tax=Noviherbaspirillum album TaxID=3080276 RepID=UPI002DD6964D|nr:cytochrome c biogenesis heme-transporting ATPase CcmA [Noviherbaspirillum sp. CPCC 100848]
MLEAIRLACTRGDSALFTSLSFRVEQGSILRIAGPNGSGKTSLLRLLCGLRQPDDGDIRWRGASIYSSRENYHSEVTYIGHANALKDELLVEENLRFALRLNGGSPTDDTIHQALESAGLAHLAGMRVRALSVGQRRRVALTRLALSRAPLWILDEPFVALDQSAVAALAKYLEDHVDGGGSIVYTSHEDVPLRVSRAAEVHLGYVG